MVEDIWLTEVDVTAFPLAGELSAPPPSLSHSDSYPFPASPHPPQSLHPCTEMGVNSSNLDFSPFCLTLSHSTLISLKTLSFSAGRTIHAHQDWSKCVMPRSGETIQPFHMQCGWGTLLHYLPSQDPERDPETRHHIYSMSHNVYNLYKWLGLKSIHTSLHHLLTHGLLKWFNHMFIHRFNHNNAQNWNKRLTALLFAVQASKVFLPVWMTIRVQVLDINEENWKERLPKGETRIRQLTTENLQQVQELSSVCFCVELGKNQ